MLEENDFINHVRCTIPYNMIINDPVKAIKQLFGYDIIIKSIIINDVITNDEDYVVDVEFCNIKFSPYKIYFLNVSDIKQLIPSSSVYGTQLQGCNVKINIPSINDYKKIIPIRINVCLTNNYSNVNQLELTFSYFGTIVKKPLSYYNTATSKQFNKYTSFMMENISKVYPENFNCKVLSNEDTINAYKIEIQQQSLFAIIDNIKLSDNFSECELGTTGYIIDINIIPNNENINGIIFIQPRRKPNLVLYFPTINFTIYQDEIKSLKKLIEIEEINMKNFEYYMNVVNS